MKIDGTDLELVSQYKWHVNDRGYAVWRGIKDGKKQTIRMHRLILNAPKGKVVDHRNHDPLDNRRENIWVCTQSDNLRNKRNQGKGYWKHSQNNNWVVEVNGKHIASVLTEREAMDLVAHIRAGGSYIKPERTVCKYGHSLKSAYDYGDGKRCKQCQSLRSKKYYRRKMS